MYRIVAMLDDRQAAHTIESCCDVRFCLKRRCWTTPDLAADAAPSKSIIPCLEPCAVFMEFARTIVRLEQAKPLCIELAPAEMETAIAALQQITDAPVNRMSEADFASPLNPRRVHWTLERLRRMGQRQKHEHE